MSNNIYDIKTFRVIREEMAQEISIEDFVRTCYQCGICTGICPKAIVKEGFLPRKMVHEMITGHAERELASGDAWDCLTCGACQEKCPMNVDFVDMVRESRRASKSANCNIAHENTLGMDFYNILKNASITPKRKKFLARDVRTDDKSDVLYFMGCVSYFDIIFKDDVGFEGMDIADNTIRLLNAVGVEPAVLDEEKCCGHDQYWRGETETFEEFAKQNAEFLKKYKTIVTACPECHRTLAVDYKEKCGIDLNVLHISEFLTGKISEIEPGETKKVTFHDSCRLGRFMGVYDAPRELLKMAGHEVLEMDKNREESICCGVSAFVNCDDENKKIRQRKMKDAVETGAEVMVTPCPKCQIHLKCLQSDKPDPDHDIKIVDLTTLLAENIKGITKREDEKEREDDDSGD